MLLNTEINATWQSISKDSVEIYDCVKVVSLDVNAEVQGASM